MKCAIVTPFALRPQTIWSFQDTLGQNPLWNCSSATSTDAYDYYTSTTNYLRVQNNSLYLKNAATNKWPWTPSNCASSYMTICEVPTANYPCPPSPPASPPPPPLLDLCKPSCCLNAFASMGCKSLRTWC